MVSDAPSAKVWPSLCAGALNMGWLSKLFVRKATEFGDPNETATYPACDVHIRDAKTGARTEHWPVGIHFGAKTYDTFKDENGHVYALITYENGEPHLHLIQKSIWQKATTQFEDTDTTLARHYQRTMEGFKDVVPSSSRARKRQKAV